MVDKELVQSLLLMYEKINLSNVYGILKKHLTDFEDFSRAVKKFTK